MWVQSLCWEDPLEKGRATHSSSLAWRIPWTEEHGGPQRVGHDCGDLARAPTARHLSRPPKGSGGKQRFAAAKTSSAAGLVISYHRLNCS